MNLRTRNGASLKLPALFLLLAGLPLVALGWVGWQLLERDRALEVQRERERVENAVTLVTRELERSLAAWGDLVAAAGIRGGDLAAKHPSRAAERETGVLCRPCDQRLVGGQQDHALGFGDAEE